MFSWKERGVGAVRVQGESKLIFVWDMGVGMESPAEDQLHQNHLSYLRSGFRAHPTPISK